MHEESPCSTLACWTIRRPASTLQNEALALNDTNYKLPALGRLYLWATHRLYNEFAWTYDLAAWIVSAGRWDRWRRMALDYVERQPVLEIGFGTGELLIEMARRGWQVAGIELSSTMHQVTASKVRRRGITAPRLQGRAQALPYPDQSFGSILATFPAEYVVDPASLREFSRVLQPGGRLIVAGMVVYRQETGWSRLSQRLFGSDLSTSLDRFQDHVADCGLATRVVLRADPPWTVPILVAERLP